MRGWLQTVYIPHFLPNSHLGCGVMFPIYKDPEAQGQPASKGWCCACLHPKRMGPVCSVPSARQLNMYLLDPDMHITLTFYCVGQLLFYVGTPSPQIFR